MQMTLPDSEHTIAGKTHSEILAMERWTRWRWYKTISSEEKEEAMKIVNVVWGAKISAAKKGKCTGKNNHNFGKTFSEETRRKISAAKKGKNHPMYGRTGEKNSNWRGGTSFLPYCPAFNSRLKESIRNRDNRTCVLCGKGEIQNGRRLSVHHINSDKMQGCNGKSWYLCALCRSCNVKPDTVEKEFLIVTNQNRIGGRR